LLAGWCANPLVARLEGQYGLQRAGANSCTLWASKWHAEASDHTAWDPKQVFKVSGHTDLSDADLAEADRQVAELSASLEYTHGDAHVDVMVKEICNSEEM